MEGEKRFDAQLEFEGKGVNTSTKWLCTKSRFAVLRSGFAARCEARLCLAVTLVKYIWG